MSETETSLLTIVMNSVIDSAFKNINRSLVRKRFYKEVIVAFQDAGWISETECMGGDPAYDSALKTVFKRQGRERDIPESAE